MLDALSNMSSVLVLGGLCTLTLFQGFLAIYLLFSLRAANKERQEIHRQLFGLVCKIEGLTASRRESMLRHYDKLLDNLSNRLPPVIAAHAGQTIFETESKILARLAEIEPNLHTDAVTKQKMDELIVAMENLEHTIVSLTSETVRKVMTDARRDLFERDESSTDIALAA